MLLCRGVDAEGRGTPTDDGFVVLEGSKARTHPVGSLSPGYVRLREELLASGILVEDGSQYKFVQDYVFSSPSAASATVLGRPSNGWTDWKDEEGRTLSASKRRRERNGFVGQKHRDEPVPVGSGVVVLRTVVLFPSCSSLGRATQNR